MNASKKKVSRKDRDGLRAAILDDAQKMARNESCSSCGSKNLDYGVGEGLCKLKPYVSCRDCGELLAWG